MITMHESAAQESKEPKISPRVLPYQNGRARTETANQVDNIRHCLDVLYNNTRRLDPDASIRVTEDGMPTGREILLTEIQLTRPWFGGGNCYSNMIGSLEELSRIYRQPWERIPDSMHVPSEARYIVTEVMENPIIKRYRDGRG